MLLTQTLTGLAVAALTATALAQVHWRRDADADIYDDDHLAIRDAVDDYLYEFFGRDFDEPEYNLLVRVC